MAAPANDNVQLARFGYSPGAITPQAGDRRFKKTVSFFPPLANRQRRQQHLPARANQWVDAGWPFPLNKAGSGLGWAGTTEEAERKRR